MATGSLPALYTASRALVNHTKFSVLLRADVAGGWVASGALRGPMEKVQFAQVARRLREDSLIKARGAGPAREYCITAKGSRAVERSVKFYEKARSNL